MSLPKILFCAFLVACAASAGWAQDWIVSKVSQPARYTADVRSWHPLDVGMAVPNESWIHTGKRGRLILRRGEEMIQFKPNTVASIKASDEGGAVLTAITQKYGSVLIDVETRQTRHASVETPYLAAVVKGTRFQVDVTRSGAALRVLRGLVETTDLVRGERVDVRAGQQVSVAANGADALTVRGRGPKAPVKQVAPATPRVAPAIGSNTADDRDAAAGAHRSQVGHGAANQFSPFQSAGVHRGRQGDGGYRSPRSDGARRWNDTGPGNDSSNGERSANPNDGNAGGDRNRYGNPANDRDGAGGDGNGNGKAGSNGNGGGHGRGDPAGKGKDNAGGKGNAANGNGGDDGKGGGNGKGDAAGKGKGDGNGRGGASGKGDARAASDADAGGSEEDASGSNGDDHGNGGGRADSGNGGSANAGDNGNREDGGKNANAGTSRGGDDGDRDTGNRGNGKGAGGSNGGGGRGKSANADGRRP